jgi:hypothetical protein
MRDGFGLSIASASFHRRCKPSDCDLALSAGPAGVDKAHFPERLSFKKTTKFQVVLAERVGFSFTP